MQDGAQGEMLHGHLGRCQPQVTVSGQHQARLWGRAQAEVWKQSKIWDLYIST